MRIAISTSSIEPELNVGILDGIGHYTQQVSSNLKSLGHSVSHYAFPRILQESNLYYSNKLPKSYVHQLIASSVGLVNPLKIDADLFHSTDYKIVPMSCPVIATIWDALSFIHPEWLKKGISRILIPRLYRQSAKYADRVIASSRHAAIDLIKYFQIPEHKIRVINWSIPKQWLIKPPKNDINNVLKKYMIDKEYILSVGTLQPRKNFSRLIDAFISIPKNKRPDMKLVIAGKIGWNSEELLKKISYYKDEVIHINNITDSDLQCLYRAARAFVFPSLHEGFGIPILEAFASNIPIVASNTTSIPEVTGDAAILIDPLSTNDLRDALSEILANSDLSNTLIKRGNERLSLFSEERMMKELLEVYKEVL